MRVTIQTVAQPAQEQVVLQCMALSPDWQDIQAYCMAKGSTLAGYTADGGLRQIPYHEILYVEAVGERVFAYTAGSEYQLKRRLYELEELLAPHGFARCSKAFVINLLKVDSIRPALSGRYCARMQNGEDVIISRKYAGQVRQAIMEAL